MIKVTASNVETMAKKVMTNAEHVSVRHLKDGMLLGACEYAFTKTTTPESRACAVKKLFNAVNNLPNGCGEIFAKIV